MSTWINGIQLHWLDNEGKTCTQFMFDAVRDPAALGTAASLLMSAKAISVARLCAITKTQVYVVPEYAIPGGPYNSVRDKAQLILRCESGRTIVNRIPAPLDTIFYSGTEVVDPSNAVVIDYLDSLALFASNVEGSLVTGLDRGKRTRLG